MGCGCKKKQKDFIENQPVIENEPITESPSIKPSLLQMAKTAGGAVAQVLSGKTVKLTDEQVAARLKVCANCDKISRFHKFLPKSAPVSLADRCAECGCFLREKAKRAPAEGVPADYWDCPLKKWAKIELNQGVTQ